MDLCRLSVDHERALTKLEELEMKSLGHLLGWRWFPSHAETV